MSINNLVYPMFAMVLLSFTVLVMLFRARTSAVRAGATPVAYYRVYQGAAETEVAAKRTRNFTNLFEAPTLFYVCCLAAMVTGAASTAFLTLAWCYVATRAVHTFVHIGRNRVRHRLTIYFASWLVLLALWLYLVTAIAMRST
jgi:hypothetical protein